MNQDFEQTKASAEAEPTSAPAPAPVWLFVIIGMLAGWGMGFLDQQGGGFQAGVYAPYHSIADVGDDWPASGGGMMKLGRQVYDVKAKCTTCHQPSGLGVAGQFPPLAGSDWVLTEDPARLIRIVLHGLHGPITVNGQPFNNVMTPPWTSPPSDEEVAAVLTYIRQNKDWGNSAPEVTPEQVQAVREQTADRAILWTADELLSIPPEE